MSEPREYLFECSARFIVKSEEFPTADFETYLRNLMQKAVLCYREKVEMIGYMNKLEEGETYENEED